MAKQDSPVVVLRGIYGGMVFTNGPKLGPHMRKRPNIVFEDQDPHFKEQAHRAPILNKLASEINRIADAAYGAYKSKDFYQRILKRFRKVPSDNRYCLLQSIRKLHADERFTLDPLIGLSLDINPEVHQVNVVLKTTVHPSMFKVKDEHYRYQLLLVTWAASQPDPVYQKLKTAWININGIIKTFDLRFPLPEASQQWLLFVRLQMGDGITVNTENHAQAIQLYEAGTFLEADKEESVKVMEIMKQREVVEEEENDDGDTGIIAREDRE